MFDWLKLSTSSIILISLFVLILVIALLGYLESTKINSKLERISYQMTKQNDKCIQMCPIKSINEEQEDSEGIRELESEEMESIRENNPVEKVVLSESKQEFSEEVPEDQSAFSLGAIFNNLDSTGKTQEKNEQQIVELEERENLDKIEDDSEYSGDYGSDISGEFSESEEEITETTEMLSNKLTESELSTKTLKELKSLCEQNNVSKYGNKDALIKKLLKV